MQAWACKKQKLANKAPTLLLLARKGFCYLTQYGVPFKITYIQLPTFAYIQLISPVKIRILTFWHDVISHFCVLTTYLLAKVGQFSTYYKSNYIKIHSTLILTIGGPPLVVCTTLIAICLLLRLLDDDAISLRLCQLSRRLLSRSCLGYFASDFRQHASLPSKRLHYIKEFGQFSANYKWYYIKNHSTLILTIWGLPLVVCATFIAIPLLLCLVDDDAIFPCLCQQSRSLLLRSCLGYFASDFRQNASLSSKKLHYIKEVG